MHTVEDLKLVLYRISIEEKKYVYSHAKKKVFDTFWKDFTIPIKLGRALTFPTNSDTPGLKEGCSNATGFWSLFKIGGKIIFLGNL